MHHPSTYVYIKDICGYDTQYSNETTSEDKGEDALEKGDGKGKIIIKILLMNLIILSCHNFKLAYIH